MSFSASGKSNPFYRHGAVGTPEYTVWEKMKERCHNPNQNRYKNYGGRGIKVCDRWLGEKGFANFLNDMGKRPADHTLNRKDNDGNYEPNNCEWATYKDQARNTTTNVCFGGACMVEWAEHLKVNYKMFAEVVKLHGWLVAFRWANLKNEGVKRVSFDSIKPEGWNK